MKIKRPTQAFLIDLHDGRVRAWSVGEQTLTVTFDRMYSYTAEEEVAYQGQVIFNRIDLKDSRVKLFDTCVYEGDFSGHVISLLNFIADYSHAEFEVLSETYNAYDAVWQGQLWQADKAPIDMQINFFYSGDLVFDVEEVERWQR